MSNHQDSYDALITQLKEVALLSSCASVLSWDEQTYLPPGGTEHRANQLGLLAGLAHERATAPHFGDLLAELEQDDEVDVADSPRQVTLREARRAFDRASKLPRTLVEELSRVSTLSQQAWVDARKKSDFRQFLPWLEKVVALKREEADVIGFGNGVPYDALLDDYEPGATSADVAAVFSPLRDELVEMVASILESAKHPDISILERHYPVEAQKEFGIEAARQIGFNFNDGRLDVAAHPFCSGFGPGDCRLTTRYNPNHFPGAFFGILHEAGHGIYEQGLDASSFGTPMGESTSLGIHESQSRLWENLVGRSQPFWSYLYGSAQKAFPAALADVALGDFYAAINDVRPSFIRVEADEITYNLHIMLRFELEQPLVSGELAPADVPQVWNEMFSRYFGITPAEDAEGCLQDIHWSGGLIGYFPTYALGNMYASQLYAAAEADLGDLGAQFERGEFEPLRNWLNENVHRRGKQYRAGRLIEVVSGHSLSHEPLVKHLHQKFDPLFEL